MSELENKLEREIGELLNEIENQELQDKKKTIKLFLDKYIHLSKSDHMMTTFDLNKIIGKAKSDFAEKNVKLFLKSGNSKARVAQSDLSNLFVIESTISYLNKIDCLKKTPKFHYIKDKL